MIPKGEAVLWFYNWDKEGRQEFSVRCLIEVLMTAFTTGNCRVRGEFLEDKGPFKKGHRFGNKETALTEEIYSIIKGGSK